MGTINDVVTRLQAECSSQDMTAGLVHYPDPVILSQSIKGSNVRGTMMELEFNPRSSTDHPDVLYGESKLCRKDLKKRS